MKTSKTRTGFSKYYDVNFKIYLSRLPLGYYEKDEIVYIKNCGDKLDHRSTTILKVNHKNND